jgi:hypothetical protein
MKVEGVFDDRDSTFAEGQPSCLYRNLISSKPRAQLLHTSFKNKLGAIWRSATFI